MRPAALAFAVVALCVAALVASSCSSEDNTAGQADAPAPDDAAALTPGAGAIAGEAPVDPTAPGATVGDTGAAGPLPSTTARAAMPVRLADGDSFDIIWSDSGDRDEIRLVGLNAPEGDACFGDEARAMLASLIDGRTLLIDSRGRDDFGRVLGNVWVAAQFVNGEMIERGGALALSDGSRHAQLLADAQARAQASGTGLWSPDACGADLSLPLRIAHIEYNAPGPDNENQNGEWIEIANDGLVAFDLSGWSIRDESTRNRYNFPSGFTLDAASVVRVFSGCGVDTHDELYWCAHDPVWNNGGDTGLLVDPDGHFGDQFSYDG